MLARVVRSRGTLLKSASLLARRQVSRQMSTVEPTREEKNHEVVDWYKRMTREADKVRGQYELPDAPHPKDANSPCFAIKGSGGVRQYVFNRENVGHSLNISTVRWLTRRLWMFYREKEMTGILLRSRDSDEGNTFSVGTDLPVLLALQQGQKDTSIYHTELHQLAYLISRLHKPLIVYLNGRVGGNSSALALQSPYRVATDETSFYLPQTSYGFVPDAGISHFLSRLDGGLGCYLALTGHKLHGADLIHAGIATYFQDSDNRAGFVELLENNAGHYDSINEVLEMMDEEWQDTEFSLSPHMQSIHRCFSKNSVREIIAALKEENTPWAFETIKVLEQKSPLALEVTRRLIEEVRFKPLEDSLKIEYSVANKMMDHPDYVEGVQASVIDKRTPNWTTSITSLNLADIDKIFAQKTRVNLPFIDYTDPYAFTYALSETKSF